MNKLIKLSNILIFLSFLVLFLFINKHSHISTSLLSTIPDSKSKVLIKNFEDRKNSKILMIATKGLDKSSLEQIKKIEKKLQKIQSIQLKKEYKNRLLKKHLEQYKPFVKNLDNKKIADLNIKEKLNKLYINLTNSFIPVSIDKSDPLDLYKNKISKNNFKIKNDHLILENYGYLSYFTIDANDLNSYNILYDQIKKVLKEYKDVVAFSPIFYFVENSLAIKSEANNIISLALIILLTLYILILKNIKLLINTLISLATSSIIAIMLLTNIYMEVSIFVIVFGLCISTIAIDYMFHHYLHNYYSKNYAFNKEVFFGFITTIAAFLIFSFTDFILIKQLSIFAIISLFVSYLHFSFLYPRIKFEKKETFWIKTKISLPKIDQKIFFLFSLIIILISPFWVKFDLNLRNLDYQNSSLKEKENFFISRLSTQDNINIMIEAKSINELIHRSKKIKDLTSFSFIALGNLVDVKTFEQQKSRLRFLKKFNDLINQEATKIGFRKDYFKDAYSIDVKKPIYTFGTIKKYGIEIFKYNDMYVTYGVIDKKSFNNIRNISYIKSLSIKEVFEKNMTTLIDELMILGLFALVTIILLITVITKKRKLQAYIFLTFPFSMFLLYAYFYQLNILHIFMMFIILSLSIDYAIYTSKSIDLDTVKAISYSLLSTFAGFGVLIFTKINSLFSIGIIATIGILSITILLIFLKASKNEI